MKVQAELFSDEKSGRDFDFTTVSRQRATIVKVGYIAWENYYSEIKKLRDRGFSSLITTTVIAPDWVSEHLTPGLYVFDRDIEVTQYVSENTPYEWRYIRHKSPKESIGNGNLPGDVGEFILSALTDNDCKLLKS